MGQLLWNKSIQTRQDGDAAAADQLLVEAGKELKVGLDGIAEELADGEAMKAALVLAKVALKQGQFVASNALENQKYGPVPLLERQAAPTPSFLRTFTVFSCGF